jgi:hypothetical protein
VAAPWSYFCPSLKKCMRDCIYLLYFTLFGCIYLRLLPDLVSGMIAFIYVNLPYLVIFSFVGSIWVYILLRFMPQLGVAFFFFIYVVAVIYVNLPYLVHEWLHLFTLFYPIWLRFVTFF